MLRTVLSYAKKFILRLVVSWIYAITFVVCACVTLANGVWWAFSGIGDGQKWAYDIADLLDPVVAWAENLTQKQDL
jgi:hypothetical protein